MEPRDLLADDFAAVAEAAEPWWHRRAGIWHALDEGQDTRCGLTSGDPPYHYQQVVAETTGRVAVCADCLEALDAGAEPATAGELLLRQFRLYYVE